MLPLMKLLETSIKMKLFGHYNQIIIAIAETWQLNH